jgi:phosphate transport system ATP-binding protein
MSPEELLLMEDPRTTRESDALAGEESLLGPNASREQTAASESPAIHEAQAAFGQTAREENAFGVGESRPGRGPQSPFGADAAYSHERPHEADTPHAHAVPPVRTIVLDRPPVPVAPPVRGPSGCGKTTLLRTLNRLTELTPSAARSGEVLLDGQDIHELVDTTLRTRVAMVFQQPNPFPMSIFDNVAFALREQSRKRPRRRELEPLVVDALRRAGLYEEVRHDLDRPALRLSGGQQQRLCIARAIAPRPEVLLMDEPCSALDPISTGVIEELIGELRRELAVVIVTHNLAQARRVADKVAFMYLGDLIEYGTADEVFSTPRAARTRDYVQGTFG